MTPSAPEDPPTYAVDPEVTDEFVEAEALFAADPWIVAGGMVAEIRPFFTLPGAWQTT